MCYSRANVQTLGCLADEMKENCFLQCVTISFAIILTFRCSVAGTRSNPPVTASGFLASRSSCSDAATTVGERVNMKLQRHLLESDFRRRQLSIDVSLIASEANSSSSMEDAGSIVLDTPTSGYGSALEVGSDDSHGVFSDPIATSTNSEVNSKTSGIKALQSTLNLNYGSVGVLRRTQRFDGGSDSSKISNDAAAEDRGGNGSSFVNYERIPLKQSTRGGANPPPPPPPFRRSTWNTADDYTGETPETGTQASTNPAADCNPTILRSKSTPSDEGFEDFLLKAELLRRNYVRKSQMLTEQADEVPPSNVSPVDAKDASKDSATGNEAYTVCRPSIAVESGASNGSGSSCGEEFNQTTSQSMAGHSDIALSLATQDATTVVGMKIASDIKAKPAAPLKHVVSRRPVSNEIVEPRTVLHQLSPTATGDVAAFQVPLPRLQFSEKPPPPKRGISSQSSVYANLPDPLLTAADMLDGDPRFLPPPPSQFFANETSSDSFAITTTTTAAAAAVPTVVKPTTRPKVAPKVGIRRASAFDSGMTAVDQSTPNIVWKTIASEPLIAGRAALRPVILGKQSSDSCSSTTRAPTSPSTEGKILVASRRSSLPSPARDQCFSLPPPHVFDDDNPTNYKEPPAVTSENRRPPPTASKPKILPPKTSLSSPESPTLFFSFTDAAVDQSTTSAHRGNSNVVSDDILIVPLPPPVAYDDEVSGHNDVFDRQRRHAPQTPNKHIISAVPAPPRSVGSNVRDWSVEDVGHWLDLTSLGQHRERFRLGGIDGRQLASLDRGRLIELGVVEVGDRMSIERQLRKILPIA